jgi:hypothetical protein
MDVRVLESEVSGGDLASFGSGDSAAGGAGGALGIQSLYNRSQRLSEGSSGRGTAARRALAREIQEAAQRRRTIGGSRRGPNNLGLTDAEREAFTRRLRALSA